MPAYQMVQTKERGSEEGDKEKERRRMESSRKMRRKRREGKGEERRLSGDALDVNSRLRILKKKKGYGPDWAHHPILVPVLGRCGTYRPFFLTMHGRLFKNKNAKVFVIQYLKRETGV